MDDCDSHEPSRCCCSSGRDALSPLYGTAVSAIIAASVIVFAPDAAVAAPAPPHALSNDATPLYGANAASAASAAVTATSTSVTPSKQKTALADFRTHHSWCCRRRAASTLTQKTRKLPRCCCAVELGDRRRLGGGPRVRVSNRPERLFEQFEMTEALNKQMCLATEVAQYTSCAAATSVEGWTLTRLLPSVLHFCNLE